MGTFTISASCNGVTASSEKVRLRAAVDGALEGQATGGDVVEEEEVGS